MDTLTHLLPTAVLMSIVMKHTIYATKNDIIHLGKKVDDTALQLRIEMHLQL